MWRVNLQALYFYWIFQTFLKFVEPLIADLSAFRLFLVTISILRNVLNRERRRFFVLQNILLNFVKSHCFVFALGLFSVAHIIFKILKIRYVNTFDLHRLRI